MSQDGASQFQEVIRQELELSVKKELEKILTTAPPHEFEVRTLYCFCFHPSTYWVAIAATDHLAWNKHKM